MRQTYALEREQCRSLHPLRTTTAVDAGAILASMVWALLAVLGVPLWLFALAIPTIVASRRPA
jgi:hypothetical protein